MAERADPAGRERGTRLLVRLGQHEYETVAELLRKSDPGKLWLRSREKRVAIIEFISEQRPEEAPPEQREIIDRAVRVSPQVPAGTAITAEHWAMATEVHLGESQITDAGLAYFHGLAALIRLNLSGTQVTDAGLAHLAGLTALELLHLLDCKQVTDEGLAHLQRLKALTELDLAGTQVTAAGVARLRKALPKCNILWDEPTEE